MNDLEQIGKRLGEFLTFKQIGINELGRQMGTSGSQVFNIMNGKKYGTDKLLAVLNLFPELNIDWLLKGEGKMLKEEVKNADFHADFRADFGPKGKTNSTFLEDKKSANDSGENVGKHVGFDVGNSPKGKTNSTFLKEERGTYSPEKGKTPILDDENPSYGRAPVILPIVVTPQNTERIVAVPFFAEAGYTRGFQDTNFIQDLPHFSLPQLGEGTYRAFQIRGDSMEPSINSGDWVIGRYVDRVQGLQAGTICVVLLKDEGILCKRVEKLGKMAIVLHSSNPRYSLIEPASENIMEMWEVRAVLRYLF